MKYLCEECIGMTLTGCLWLMINRLVWLCVYIEYQCIAMRVLSVFIAVLLEMHEPDKDNISLNRPYLTLVFFNRFVCVLFFFLFLVFFLQVYSKPL